MILRCRIKFLREEFCFVTHLRAFERQQKIDGVSSLVDRTVQIFPMAFHLDVRLVDTPAATDWAFMLSEQFLQQRQNQISNTAIMGSDVYNY